jgi:hypothetical protein
MTKLGAHITPGPRDGFGEFAAENPAVVVATDQDVSLDLTDHTVALFRATEPYTDGGGGTEAPPDINSKNTSVTWEQYAHYWYDGDAPTTLKEKWGQNPADYYCITNEQGGGEYDTP